MTKRDELDEIVKIWLEPDGTDAAPEDVPAAIVDTILDALMEPGEGAIDMGQARQYRRSTTMTIWQAILTHIKEGR